MSKASKLRTFNTGASLAEMALFLFSFALALPDFGSYLQADADADEFPVVSKC